MPNADLNPDMIMVKRLVDVVDAGDVRSYAFDTGQLMPFDNSFSGKRKRFNLPAPEPSITPVNFNFEAMGDLADGGRVQFRLGGRILFFAFDDKARTQCQTPDTPEKDFRQISAGTFNDLIVSGNDMPVELLNFKQARFCNDPTTYIRMSMDYAYRGPSFDGGAVKRTIYQTYHQTLVGGMGEPNVVSGKHQRDPHTGGFVVTHDNGDLRRNRLSLGGRGVFRELLPDGSIRSFTGIRSRGELHGQMVSFSTSGQCVLV